MGKSKHLLRRLSVESLEPRYLMVGDVATNLVGHWSLNSTNGSTAVDIAGNDNSGSLVNAPAWVTGGKVHGALSFNGTNQSVSVPHLSNLAVGSNRVVVSAWIKTTAAGGTVVSKGAATSDHFALRIVGGKARFEFSIGGSPIGVTGAKVVDDGEWHLIVGVRTASRSVALFVDGVADGTFTESTLAGSIDETSQLRIGSHSNGTFFNGVIDDVRFYNGRLFDADDADTLFKLASNPIAVADTISLTSTTTSIGAASGVLTNDTPRDEVPIQAVLTRNAANGTVTLNADGSFTYVMQSSYVGTDSFEYTVDDGTRDPIGVTVQLTVGTWAIETRVYNSAMSGASSITAATVDGIVALMATNGSFTDLTYNSIDALNTHMGRLNTLARAFSVVGGPKSGNATVLQKTVSGYTYLANTAPSATSLSSSFFDTTIDVPSELWPGLIIMRSRLSSTLMNSIVTKYYDSPNVWDTSEQSDEFGGYNLAARARSTVAFQVLKNALSVLTEVRSIVTTDLQFGGRRVSSRLPDNSFAQHSDGPLGITYEGGYRSGVAVHIAAGNYGVSYVTNAADVLYWLDDTTYGFTNNAESNFVEGLLDGFAWYFKGQRMDVTIAGRANVQKGITLGSAADSLASGVIKAKRLGIQETELQALADRLSNGETANNYMQGNKSFFASDMMVQQRQGYRASVHMISQRTQRPQTVLNGPSADGAQNFFLADGVTLIHQDGNEYGSSTGQEIYPAWNWARLPGTTTEQLTRDEVRALSMDNLGTSALIGTKAFVGSVSNGTYGAAAMDYGRSLGKVTAKKGYFYFDEGFVALGAGINAPNATNPVYTTLNQVVQDGSVTVKNATGTTQTFSSGITNSYTDPRWISHGGVGYLMLGGNGTVTAQIQSQTGPWNSISAYGSGSVTRNVFSAWVDHGNNPSGDKYAYAVLPGATTAALDSYFSSSTFSVLSNTTSIQAVRKASSGLTQIAFYQAGSLTIASGLTVTVDQPCMLQLRELVGGHLELSISDPRQIASQVVRVNVTRQLSGPSTVWQPSSGFTQITFAMPSGTNNVYAGQSVVATFNSVVASPVLTVTSTSRTYNQATYAATASIAGNNLPIPSLSFQYYSDAAGTNIIPSPKNVGTYYVRAFSAANAANNAAQSSIASFQITSLAITGSITVANKNFDGNTSATILTRTLSGVLSGDVVSYIGGIATFANAAVGNGKTVTATGLSLSGADAGNYSVNSTAVTTASILDPAPAVTSIIAGGSAWSPAFIDSVDGGGAGAGNGLGYAITPNFILPNSGINRIYVQFSEAVFGFNASAVRLLGVNIADYATIVSVTYDSVNMRGIIAMNGSNTLNRDKLRLGIADTVTDASLNALDGDANGSAGGNLDLRFNVIIGDANGDGSVNGGDLPSFAASFNKSVGNAAYNPRADWNADSSGNGGDLPLFAANFNQSLPTSEPAAITFPPPLAPTALESLSTPLIDYVDEFFGQFETEEEELVVPLA